MAQHYCLATRPPLGELTLNESLQEEHNREMRPFLRKLLKSARILKLPAETTFTAAVLLHRYKISSNMTIDAWIIATCLLLACKREEEPRRLRDFINCSYLMQNRPLPDLDEAYWDAKKKLIRTEQIVLRWLTFDVSVSRPHRAIVAFLLHDVDDDDDNKCSNRDLALLAFRKLNNTIFSIQALEQGADVLAIAALRLALLDSTSLISVSDERRTQLHSLKRWGDKLGLHHNHDQQVESIQKSQDMMNAERPVIDKDSNG